MVLLGLLIRVGVGGEVEAERTDCGCTLDIARLTSHQACPNLDVVTALGPANRTCVLEGIVDVLQGNVRTVADVTEGSNRDWRQRVGKRTEVGHGRGETDFLVDTNAIVQWQGEIIDASEACPEVHQQVRGEDVGVTQFVLLGYVGSGTVEVVPAAADLNSILSSESWRGEGVDGVIGEACEEQVSIIQLVIDAGV